MGRLKKAHEGNRKRLKNRAAIGRSNKTQNIARVIIHELMNGPGYMILPLPTEAGNLGRCRSSPFSADSIEKIRGVIKKRGSTPVSDCFSGNLLTREPRKRFFRKSAATKIVSVKLTLETAAARVAM